MASQHAAPLVGVGAGPIVPSSTVNPLLSLATLATSRYQHEAHNREVKSAECRTPPTFTKMSYSAPPVSKVAIIMQRPPPAAAARMLTTLRVILQRPATAKAWGVTLSMLDRTCLVLGCVDRALVAHFSALAARTWQTGRHVPTIQTGDLIRSLNGRPIASFPSFLAVTEYLKQNYYLSFEVVRALDLPYHLQIGAGPEHAYSISAQAYRWIQPHLGAFIKTLPPPPRVVSTDNSFQLHKVQKKASKTPKPTRKHIPFIYTNPLFRDDAGRPLPYDDDFELDQRMGTGVSQFVAPVECFPTWLAARKKTWRQHWNPYQLEDTAVREHTPFIYTNPLFRDDAGKPLSYEDDFDLDQRLGTGISQFMAPLESFPTWLAARKKTWRQHWNPYQLEDTAMEECIPVEPLITVAKDFWSSQGYASFEEWRCERTTGWKRKYSWNQRKKRQIEEVAEQIVHFPSSCGTEEQFQEWLRVRKGHWRILRVKRQRKLEQQFRESEDLSLSQPSHAGSDGVDETETRLVPLSPLARKQTTGDMFFIDSLLEEKERKRQAHLATFDLAFIFDARLGAPDDVIAHCFRYLHPSEHGKLLCVSATTSKAIVQRDEMWRQLCPQHWILPRRPRKRWHDLYISKMRLEVQASRKLSDDLLSRIASELFKGDFLTKVERLVAEGEKKFDFGVNYHSGVVCERNSMLNLAVINGRLKVVRWLIETKGADRESCDRGGFTPLINAAWDGNIRTVRFLLSKGCDRAKVGTGHYTKPLAAPDFEGYTAEGWARDKGHREVADLIRVGL